MMDRGITLIIAILAVSGMLIPLVYLLRYVLANRHVFCSTSTANGKASYDIKEISIFMKDMNGAGREIRIERNSKEGREISIEAIEYLIASTREAD